MVPFGQLFNSNELHSNGKTNQRKNPVPIDKRGGRIRASMMTDIYETHFENLQSKTQYIPLNYFHSSLYGDIIMKNVICILLKQQKYEPMEIMEVWTQTELRKQVEVYYREMKTMFTKRSYDKDLHQIVAWWYDEDIGIKTRIKRFNESGFLTKQPFDFNLEVRPILGEKRISHSDAKQATVSDDFDIENVEEILDMLL